MNFEPEVKTLKNKLMQLDEFNERQVDLRIDGVVRKYTLLIKEKTKPFEFTLVE